MRAECDGGHAVGGIGRGDAELIAFLRERDRATWDQQIDEDFAEDGRPRPVLDEVWAER